jgi:hypothetical protein
MSQGSGAHPPLLGPNGQERLLLSWADVEVVVVPDCDVEEDVAAALLGAEEGPDSVVDDPDVAAEVSGAAEEDPDVAEEERLAAPVVDGGTTWELESTRLGVLDDVAPGRPGRHFPSSHDSPVVQSSSLLHARTHSSPTRMSPGGQRTHPDNVLDRPPSTKRSSPPRRPA